MARKQLAGRSAPADRARKLIREIGGTPDDGLAAEWERVVAPLSRPDETIVRLSDGRILSISYCNARIFYSADECLQLLAFVEQQTGRQRSHLLGAAYPGGQGFIAAVPEPIASLPEKLRLAAGTLDGGLDSLMHLDTAAQQLGGPKCLDDPTLLAPIVAYVGEVVRNATDGRWVIRSWEIPGASPALSGNPSSSVLTAVSIRCLRSSRNCSKTALRQHGCRSEADANKRQGKKLKHCVSPV